MIWLIWGIGMIACLIALFLMASLSAAYEERDGWKAKSQQWEKVAEGWEEAARYSCCGWRVREWEIAEIERKGGAAK